MKPWLWLSPALAHKLSPVALNGISMFSNHTPAEWRAWNWRNLNFPNRLGVAGGVDKNAQNVRAWWSMGAGFIEIGTVTPKPQPGNPGVVVDRDLAHGALWNRLGFPSHGVERVRARLSALQRPFPTPLFANIGKNATTSLDDASKDYVLLLERLTGLVDGFVVNISSPNTAGLRELLKPARLRDFLTPIMAARPRGREPILLKLSPDMSDAELETALQISIELDIDGWILTNTSQGLREGLSFPEGGGVSGRPLSSRSRQFLKNALNILGANRRGRLVVSVGGVMSESDVFDRLALGADLVQVYSALIFEGPYFFRRVAACPQANPNLR
ncbi:MAG TPA: quinone-dependent dihydroorotate dehydrogenase [Bdellovibrionales bacterium]|nr:quinone-dependent dihydroorotate dehydrogenase [Bdellovibrionales bacterium]